MGNEATEAASIVGDLVQAMVGSAQHLYDVVREADESFRAEDALREASHLIERVAPIAERSINLTLDLLRPWSKAFVDRIPDA